MFPGKAARASLVIILLVVFRDALVTALMAFSRAWASASRSAACMSAAAGVALAVYQGLCCRRSSMPTAGSQEIAYQQIMRDWTRNAKGTVHCRCYSAENY